MASQGTDQEGMTPMNNSRISRRSLIVNGSGLAAAGVVLAACSTPDPGLARIGDAPTTTALPEAKVSDVVLLRTLQSVENLAVNALTDAGIAGKADAKTKAALAAYVQGHKSNLARLDQLVGARGGESVTEANPKLTANYVDKAKELIADSDEPETDVLMFVTELEAMVAGTYQAFVAWTNEPALRSQMMSLALDPSQFSAATAQMIRGGSKGIVPAKDDNGADLIATIPSAFGPLSTFSAMLGKPNEAGIKATLNLETPSLNSLEY